MIPYPRSIEEAKDMDYYDNEEEESNNDEEE